jgi:predicted DNA-binding transcriptional regulator YafY
MFDYDDAVTLAMNRVTAALLLDESAIYPAKFSIDEKLDAGILGFGDGKKMKVELLFDKDSGDHLLESPLSKDQQCEEQAEGKLKFTATIADTPQLRWWLMGFGSEVEILAPTSLREEIFTEYQKACAIYSTDHSH